MKIENFDYKELARILSESGVINKSFMEMSVDEINTLISTIWGLLPRDAFSDVPF